MLRFFLAIQPPPEMVESMLALLATLELPPHRPPIPAQTHLTAMFLGERREGEIDGVVATAAHACKGIRPFRLRPVLLTALPERGPKRTVVVECDRPSELVELHDRFVRRFASEASLRRRDRFLPHVTIARFGGAGVELSVKSPLSIGDFPVNAIRLMSSDLKPEGAIHTEVARFEFEN